MSRLGPISTCIFLLFSSFRLWCQSDTTRPASGDPQDNDMQSQASDEVVTHPEDRMLTPPPVGTLSFPLSLGSGERANYLRYGLSFTTTYNDNTLLGSSQTAVSDISYSVAPTIAIDETTSRLHWVAKYAPGFTFYQRISERNESDHNAAVQVTYRLSPHVTLSAEDHFQKSSNVFNNSNIDASMVVSGASQVPNFLVVPPTADRLSNTGSVGLTYQYSRNQMVGGSGVFTRLDYPHPTQAPGLFNANSQSGSAFYSFRLSKMHYIGAAYQYQRLLSYPSEGRSETQTHAAILFYTLSPSAHFSMSLFGGPQHSDTVLPPSPPGQPAQFEAKSWDPAVGASLSWQQRSTSFAVSYARVVAGSGGLVGAVHTDTSSGALRRKLMKHLNAEFDGGYARNRVIASTAVGSQNGHTVFGAASLSQQFGQHISVQLGYMRLHQRYEPIPVLSANPDSNREFLSISYDFSRSLGR
jgi:hypothetical protein